MKVLVDTNIFISLIQGSGRSTIAKKLINSNNIELGASHLTLLEIRTVLTKKKQRSQTKVEEIIDWLKENLDFLVTETPGAEYIEDFQQDTLLYPMDCLIMSSADLAGAVPVTFDDEMKHHNAVDPIYLL